MPGGRVKFLVTEVACWRGVPGLPAISRESALRFWFCVPISSGSSPILHPRQAAHRPAPRQPPLHEHRGDHFRLQCHATSTLGRQLVFGKEVADPPEGEKTVFDAFEAHAAKADASGTSAVLGRNDLIRREWHAAAIGERHEGPGRSVLYDVQAGRERGPFEGWLLLDAASQYELHGAENGSVFVCRCRHEGALSLWRCS